MSDYRGFDEENEDKIFHDNSLPEKSREKYNSCYNKFIEWSNDKECYELTEKLILDYFIEMSKTKKPSTLLSTYSMLKHTILSNDEIDITGYRKLHLFLKKISFGYQSQKPKTFTTNDIVKFLRDAPDQKYLATKVALILGISGSCRSDELCNIRMNDLEDNGTSVKLKIRNSDMNIERKFEISDGFYRIFRKYIDLRPNNPRTDRLFMKYNDGKCTRQVIGIHKFGGMPRSIASWLKLPEPEAYTGPSFRLTSATLRASSDNNILTLGRCLEVAVKNDDELARKSSAKSPKFSKDIVQSSTPSTSALNFEAIYLPLGEVSDDKDCASKSRENNASVEKDKCKSRKLRKVKLQEQNPSSGRILRSSTATAATALVNQPQAPSKIQVPNATTLKATRAASLTAKVPQQQTSRLPQNCVRSQTAEVCLRWNSYSSNMQNSFPSLLHSEEFVDVTLACEGKSVKCHKIILCSCSDYLAQLLRENPCHHPIILMKDLKFWELEALVKFMYNGEVNVPHDKLPQLLNAARALQVKGLTKSTSSNISKRSPLAPQSRVQAPSSIPPNPPQVNENDSIINSSTPQLTETRGIKRPCESEEPQPFLKIRLQHPQSSASPKLPIIKSEPLDFTQDTCQRIDDNSLNLNDENNMVMHENDDPGGEEESDCPENDSSVAKYDPGDIGDGEQLILMPADFLDQKIIEECSRELSGSIGKIIDIDKRLEEPDDNGDKDDFNERDNT